MRSRFLEATNQFNWGKFLLLRPDAEEWNYRTTLGGCDLPVLRSNGWTTDEVLIVDLATGEGATFMPGGLARADLRKRKIHICVLFPAMLDWLYRFVRETGRGWWEQLPALIELNDAPAGLYGGRLPGDRVKRPQQGLLMADIPTLLPGRLHSQAPG